MPHFALLEILALGFLCALVLGWVTHRLRLSPIVGYLLAGFLLGPYSPGYVADARIAGQLAEVGVILLMFGVGMHFDPKDLLAVKGIAIPGAIVQIGAAAALGTMAMVVAGLPLQTAVMLGLGLSIASTVVLTRVLADQEMLDTMHGHVALGWLIVQDIVTVLLLVLLPAFAAVFEPGEGVTASALLFTLGKAVLKLVVLWLLVLPIGGRFIPWVMSQVARSRSRELFLLTVLVMAFVISTGSAVVFGTSIALGAFLAGMVVGRTTVSHQAAEDVLPMRDAFAVLFFLSIGMLFNPALLWQEPALVVAGLCIIFLVTPLISFLLVVIAGYSVRTALTVGLGLAQIGEFSFILAKEGLQLNLMSEDGYGLLVALALISIALNPVLFRLVDPLEEWLRSRRKLWAVLNRRAERQGRDAGRRTEAMLAAQETGRRAIIIGYGPVGQRVAALLRELAVQPVIVDLNVDTVHHLAEEGKPAIYGDGSRRGILENAGIDKADYLLITFPNLTKAIATITTARDLNPRLKILARTHYVESKLDLENAGATAIACEEEEIARAMVEALEQVVGEDAEGS